jgi:hypothetical protein
MFGKNQKLQSKLQFGICIFYKCIFGQFAYIIGPDVCLLQLTCVVAKVNTLHKCQIIFPCILLNVNRVKECLKP